MRLREPYIHPEQIPVQIQLELAALHVSQALGDGQPQPAAFRAPGQVASDKPLRQLIRRKVELLLGYVFQGKFHLVPAQRQVRIHPGPGHRVFRRVAEDVFQHAPHPPSVHVDDRRLFRHIQHHSQVPCGEFLRHLSLCLADQLS